MASALVNRLTCDGYRQSAFACTADQRPQGRPVEEPFYWPYRCKRMQNASLLNGSRPAGPYLEVVWFALWSDLRCQSKVYKNKYKIFDKSRNSASSIFLMQVRQKTTADPPSLRRTIVHWVCLPHLHMGYGFAYASHSHGACITRGPNGG